MTPAKSARRPGRTVIIAIAAVLGGGVRSAPAQPSPPRDVLEVLGYFEDAFSAGPDAYLKAMRPPPLPAATRARVLASLPPEGEAQPASNDRRKLTSLKRVLQYHERSDTVEVKVIRIFQAFIGFHARSLVLISEHALRLLSAEELQALVAHELGHEYFWEEYALARQEGQTPQIRKLELRCDGVAVVTMVGLGLDPQYLASGITKINRFNARFGVPSDKDFYASEHDRASFIEAMAGLVHAEFAPLRAEAQVRSP